MKLKVILSLARFLCGVSTSTSISCSCSIDLRFILGHTKGLCALIAKLARLRNNYVTLFTGVSLVNKVLNEVEKQFLSEGEEHIKKHVRYVMSSSMELLFTKFVKGNRTVRICFII